MRTLNCCPQLDVKPASRRSEAELVASAVEPTSMLNSAMLTCKCCSIFPRPSVQFPSDRSIGVDAERKVPCEVIRLHGTEGGDDSLGADDPVRLCTHLSSYVAS